MNKVFVFVIMFLFSSVAVFAQKETDPKKVAKEWAKKKKELDPMQLKKIVEENDALKDEKTIDKQLITNLESKLKVKEELNRSMQTELDSLRNLTSQGTLTKAPAQQQSVAVTEPTKKQTKTTQDNSSAVGKGEKISTKGVVFKVQIGTFRNKDLSKYLDNSKNFSGDLNPDGSRSYTLGYFSDYWEADTFKKYLREMGVTDAWVVAYKDGTRVSLKDVLEGAIE